MEEATIATAAVVSRALGVCSTKYILSESGMSPFQVMYLRFCLTLPMVFIA